MIPLRDENPSHRFPFLVVLLIVLCVIGFVLEVLQGEYAERFIFAYAVIPEKISHGRDYYTLVTSMFLHAGLGHLIGNLWYLWIFGDNLEDYLGHLGFALFYLVTGVVAGALHVALYPGSEIPTIGASGAISGIMGGYIVLHPRIRVVTLIPIFFFFQIVRIPAVFFLGIWFLMNAFGILGGNENIAFAAHLGGFVCGALLMAVIARLKPRRSNRF